MVPEDPTPDPTRRLHLLERIFSTTDQILGALVSADPDRLEALIRRRQALFAELAPLLPPHQEVPEEEAPSVRRAAERLRDLDALVLRQADHALADARDSLTQARCHRRFLETPLRPSRGSVDRQI